MATAAKFVLPIPICLVYLVPLDVDVVPMLKHIRYDFPIQTLFGSSFPPGVRKRDHVLSTLFVFVCVE